MPRSTASLSASPAAIIASSAQAVCEGVEAFTTARLSGQ